MMCKKCGKEIKEDEICTCTIIEKKGFVKRGMSKLIGVLKKIDGE